MTRSTPDKAALITRLHRIEGQLRGIARMIEQDSPCIDVLTQISAATQALRSVTLIVLDDHLHHRVDVISRSEATDRSALTQKACTAIIEVLTRPEHVLTKDAEPDIPSPDHPGTCPSLVLA
ncbi:metal-sensitive transcriptional regulator [Aestuariimicrobium sp. T2.26MG-19.2B]|uniref:metal-sensitive transcriptional regulator n=1 Tax=Aestuariimicrobium sp. T2.26MG-19.2B TaxID=3040679 RepID=UPI00253F866C|nr:metal-sensitive transcriptional regulator [Aestuariimicrobium sp. T2.26MG-19.2B]